VKRLVVNADDFGHSDEVNTGVAEAHERGIVTSTSLMVRRPAAEAAAAYARSHPELGLGLHVELGEWEYRDGEWIASGRIADGELARDVKGQLERFRELAGHEPTHLDSHQHAHRDEPARSFVQELGRELGVHVRHFGPVRYCGRFYGQDDTGTPHPELITAEALAALLRSLPDGTTELCCHPGKGAVPGSSYAREREHELEALCDARVRAAIAEAGIELVTFRS
jgi:predicted glycoside hydrolase/deacetylase ChbG (UPF0249 family)